MGVSQESRGKSEVHGCESRVGSRESWGELKVLG
jgi:hypothetical protein